MPSAEREQRSASPETGWDGGAGRVLHSQHYGVALVRALLEVERLDGRAFLLGAAAQLAHAELAHRGADAAAVEELFRGGGLGRLDLSRVGAGGGEAVLWHSHFALAWGPRYGRARQPVCAVPEGMLGGALEAVLGRPFAVQETECAAQGAAACRFRVQPTDEGLVPVTEPQQHPLPRPAPVPEAASRLEEPVARTLFESGLVADAQGRIHGPGGTLTRLWSDLYPHAAQRFERAVPRAMGAKFTNLPTLILAEASHVHGFHGLGAVMRSPEWTARIRPLLESREDWLHGAVAVINAMGWGTWRVETLVPGERLSVRVYGSHEALSYRRHFGTSATPRCHLARGTAAALMNLLYVGDITGTEALTPSYYNQLFRSPLSFRAVETRCGAMDHPYCELIANPLSPNLSARLREDLEG